MIYLGALSKVLPFFVRISYLVLPDPLMDMYRRERSLFRQSASVPEQCVLAEYIRSGEMRKQIRRLRRLYQEKGRKTEYLLQAYFGTAVEVSRVVFGRSLSNCFRIAFKRDRADGSRQERRLSGAADGKLL